MFPFRTCRVYKMHWILSSYEGHVSTEFFNFFPFSGATYRLKEHWSITRSVQPGKEKKKSIIPNLHPSRPFYQPRRFSSGFYNSVSGVKQQRDKRDEKSPQADLNMPPPSPTLVDRATRVLHARQSTVTVTSAADTSDQSASSPNLSGGAIAGIVIGSIAGLLLLWWIFRSCSNLGGPPQEEKRDAAWYDDVGAGHRGRRHRSHSRAHSRGRRGSYYAREVHTPRRSGSREVRTVQPVVYEPRRPSRTHDKHRRRSRSEGRAYYVG